MQDSVQLFVAEVKGEHCNTAKCSRDQEINPCVALFADPSSARRSAAAQFIADELGVGLVRVDLSKIVSKYIGETEKNLDRVFDEAESSGAVLFFDEADSVFGRRSEIRDFHDRYADLETSYLLQRIEKYRGPVILTCNHEKDIEPALFRRLRHVINFPPGSPK